MESLNNPKADSLKKIGGVTKPLRILTQKERAKDK